MDRVRDPHSHTAAWMPLVKARVALMEEHRKDAKMDEAMCKRFITPGPFWMTVRAPCGQSLAVQMSFKIVVLSNFPLRMNGSDPAALGRLSTFAYQTTFDKANADNQALMARMETTSFLDEAFSWLVEGAVQWYRNGGQTPLCKHSDVAGTEVRNQSAPIDAFLRTMCEPLIPTETEAMRKQCKEERCFVTNELLFRAYETWFAREIEAGTFMVEGDRQPSRTTQRTMFYRDLTSRNIASTQFWYAERETPDMKTKGRAYLGIKLRERPVVELTDNPPQ
jgi:phage/plasmid-associated DNA primase